MTIDWATMGFAGGMITVCAGFFLLLHWWQNCEATSAFVWGVADLACGVAILCT